MKNKDNVLHQLDKMDNLANQLNFIVKQQQPLETYLEGLEKSLSNIAKNSENESYRIVANLLNKNSNLLSNELKIVREIGKNDFLGNYNPDTNTITIQDINHTTIAKARGKNAATREEYENTIIHETIHAETVAVLREFRSNPTNSLFTSNPLLVNSLKRITELYNQAKKVHNTKHSKKDGQGYNSLNALAEGEGFKNEEEFITYALTNVEFQKMLADMKSEGGFKSILERLKTILSAMYKALAINLGIDIKGTVLQDVIDETFNLIELQNIEIKEDKKIDNISTDLNSLGLKIPEFMRTLSKEERFKLRTMMNRGEIQIKCN